MAVSQNTTAPAAAGTATRSISNNTELAHLPQAQALRLKPVYLLDAVLGCCLIVLIRRHWLRRVRGQADDLNHEGEGLLRGLRMGTSAPVTGGGSTRGIELQQQRAGAGARSQAPPSLPDWA